ncbi:hypothetical protein [Streptomyces sp. NPDC001930]|uniref:hypothetical protein n=1 Tax=Streptomyces sp. NPDC001930 TaxID=3364625 RepID=UPI003690FF02
MKKLTSSGQEPEERPEPEDPGPDQSVERQHDGPKWLRNGFSGGFVEGAGQALGVAVGGLLIAVTGFAASGVATEMQNGPHQEGGAAVSCKA